MDDKLLGHSVEGQGCVNKLQAPEPRQPAEDSARPQVDKTAGCPQIVTILRLREMGRSRLSRNRKIAGLTLVHTLLSLSLASSLALFVCGFSFYAAWSYHRVGYFTTTAKRSQIALDEFTRQVRQTRHLVSYSIRNGEVVSLTLQDLDGEPLTFTYDQSAKKLYRCKDGVNTTFVSGCDSLHFVLYDRRFQPLRCGGTSRPAATNCKAIELTWKYSGMGYAPKKDQADLVESTTVVMRSSQDTMP